MRIALYQPDIPQNTGNILRLAACLGVSVDIIEPAGFVFDDKRLQRSLMDYKKHLNYKRHVDWEIFYKWCKNHNYRLILLTTKSHKKYYEFKYNKKDILLFGRESAGVPNSIHQCVDERLVIPMQKGLRSLNVSSAVSMIMGEALKQLNYFYASKI
jgi:tRNA (cytidine/uridine-2'-O-)-methyltransferase